jgi:uncharacterized protein YutE (UPF0331/DUF86 family)
MALNSNVIDQRLQLLESYVRQLQGYRQRTLEEVPGDVGLTWAIEHGLQLSIQCFIDVCHYLYAPVEIGRVYDTLQNHLDDFGQFAQHVLHFLART